MLEINKQKILDKLPRVKRAIMQVNYTVILERIHKNRVRLDNSLTQYMLFLSGFHYAKKLSSIKVVGIF